MISIVITSFKEPETIGGAIEAVLNQNIREDYELVVAAPDKETQDVIRDYSKKYKKVRLFEDPGKGKSVALNMLFKELKGDIWFFTDGDVYLGDNSINHALDIFKVDNVACVTGRVVSSNSKGNIMGYWSHLLADAGAHNIRKEQFKKAGFIECSGYLFAFKNNGIVKEIPLDVAEDAYIPYMFWSKGYRVGYAEKALVYVKNPEDFKDWVKQRKRTASAHENLTKYAKDFPKVKSFFNEAKKGMVWAWSYPNNLKEYCWTFVLFFARFYMWMNLFHEIHFKKKRYNDGWERIESTK